MKCTNCGKNNAVNHYRFEENGKVTEAHLCHECACKLQPEKEFAARGREMLSDMFSGGFFGDSLFDRAFGGLTGRTAGRGLLDSFFGHDPFEGFFGVSPFAMLGMPRIEITFPEAAKTDTQEGAEAENETHIDPELSKKREINALREQMCAAAEAEDYEKAAELRDKLRAMESDNKE